MVFFLVRPRAHQPAVAVHAGIVYVAVHALFFAQPVVVIIRQLLAFGTASVFAAVIVQMSVVQLNAVEAQHPPQGMHMHLAHALGVIPRLTQFARQRIGIIPWHAVLIAGASGMAGGHAGHQNGAGGNAGGAGGIRVGIVHAPRGQRVQMRRLHIRMPGKAHGVAAHFIHHNHHDVGTVRHRNSSFNNERCVFSLPYLFALAHTKPFVRWYSMRVNCGILNVPNKRRLCYAAVGGHHPLLP